MNTQKLLDKASELECRVMYDEPLSSHTTFRTGGKCTAMVDISSEESLAQLISLANELSVRYIVIGNGSNLLFDDKGFDGVVFLMGSSIDEIKMIDETTIYAQAGCSLIKLCRFALEHNLTGLEFAYGIPGTVGGAIYMNAGAYDGEIRDVIKSCTAVSTDGTVHTVSVSNLGLGYRTSCFQRNDEVISSGLFCLETGVYDDIQDKMVELMGRRRSKQPLEFPSAGSTFKRPEGQFAGKLIQDCGLRGYTVGGAQVSEKHCGFVVNKGGATTEDILSVIRHVQNTVKEQTGYMLECEVKIIPYSE
ncbi:UDP-N-acetylmuramate dehydrogenase [Ruminococcus sp.]|uniref:UDP-N-acetylmuramate dehydrogenase n=1 Tax=Ruminococcus sp. TaxID=41978 RepID=UPI0025ECD2C5|nr:UDP-N-acetylmuramate dehydrogenase [Ruminococcus sp.]